MNEEQINQLQSDIAAIKVAVDQTNNKLSGITKDIKDLNKIT